MERNRGKLLLGSLLCLIASMAWGGMFPVAGRAMQYIDAFYFTVIRYVSTAALLVFLLWVKEGKQAFRLEGKGKPLLFFGTMAFTIYNILIFWGQHQMGDSGVIAASLMEAMMPMISIGIIWVIRKAAPPRYAMLCMGISLVGCFLVITKGDVGFFMTLGHSLLPISCLFIAVVGWVVYTLGGSQFGEWSILRYSTLSCLFGTIVTTLIVAVATLVGWVELPALSAIWTVKYEMLYMIIVAGLIALLSWNAGIKMLTPLNGILFINFVPITTLVIMALQGYEIVPFEYYGTVLVIAALVYNNIHQRRAANAQTSNKDKVRLKLARRSVSQS